MQTNTQHQSGFTIVELLIASVIIAVGILAWAKTLESGIKNRAISNDITTASELATAKMEELSFELQEKLPTNDPNATIRTQGVDFFLEWDINREKLTETSQVKIWKIEMEVTWNRYGSKQVRYSKIVVGG